MTFHLSTSYSDYKPGFEEKAWHKPAFELSVGAKYSFHDKILVDFDLITLGKRYAKPYIDTLSAIELNPIIDFNMGIEYKYSKLLSIYLDFYNLGSSKYYYWNQYPNHRVNFLLGFSYKI
ncbi:MAG: hypothetical protein HC906_10090 [Bacteroidales bacterium]|nr:hypothetical protein [Bacteroidales bacterium]